eukprot:gene1579-3052_t
MNSANAKYSFLSVKDQNSYLNQILKLSSKSCKDCLQKEDKYLEIEFPSNRKSDLSVTETLDTNRMFVREFVKSWSEYGKDLWVVFPDATECSLAKKSKAWGENLPFTITSIAGACSSPVDLKPKLIIVVNPGFNVEEWIEIPKLQRGDAPIIIINGNLDRLRNGYYPRIFYPGLYQVNKDFYSRFTQALFLSPVAIGGDRFGAWLARIYPGDWDLLVKDPAAGELSIISSSINEPNPTEAWNIAKKESSKRTGGSWF